MSRRIASLLASVTIVSALGLPLLSAQSASADGSAATWYAEYYGNTSLVGAPLVTRYEPGIGYDWGTGAPVSGVPADGFSVRWTAVAYFDGGDYTFTTTTDDGVRLYVDDALVIDRWYAMSTTSHTAAVSLAAGNHALRMEYFDSGMYAYALLTWQVTTIARGGNIITCLAPPPTNTWIKVYRWEGDAWVDINEHGWGPIDASGFLKIDGIPVDTGLYGGSGQPYRVQLYIDGALVRSVGDTSVGEAAFRVYAGHDNGTPWACPIS